ncbi:hypothetical protein FE257_011533 [Aspergillus nanangensis]|uniref:Protein arginine N-methyltransferase n=1 Tax=Aspergillus nanangensis TaxID=2582783 RepID=A0AAD4CHK9_ASPNN|nr:hypothetical protein FE257_011533 [Aspergillus nanangensis]
MDSYTNPEDVAPAFCIGHHESKRTGPVTAHIIQAAHESNYDMITSSITTPYFHSRVLGLLSSHLSNDQGVSFDSTGTLETSENARPLVIPPLEPLDTYLTPNESMTQLVGVTSSWIDLCSPDPLIADISRQVLMLEVAYAAFCGIGYILIPGPKLHHRSMHSEGIVYYARAVQDAINIGPYLQFHIWLRVVDNPELEVEEIGDLAPFARLEFLEDWDDDHSPKVDPFGTWDAWDTIRRTCKYHSRLFIALLLPKHLPPMSVQSRWHSEPVHLLTIDTNCFIKNQKGYPVLSKGHQALISRLMRLRTAPWIILCDVGSIPGVEATDLSTTATSNVSSAEYPSLTQSSISNKKHHDPTPYLSYMRNLQQRQPPRTAIERFGVGYQDYLQAPLQPLTVNLESITYEVFEKDPIKYEWYERAIAKALSDWAEQKKPTSNPDGRVVVAVVGAGRGPLVTRAIKASVETGVDIDLWVVEKNPNAFVLLQRHNKDLWGGKVTLVQSDMRSWKGPRVAKTPTLDPREGNPVGESLGIKESFLYSGGEHPAQAPKPAPNPPATTELVPATIDIVISELLGSFGDNELSPECLDGITPLLNPVHGISIPASYTAHLTPISAPKLHAAVANQSISNPAAPETPYVVMLHAIDYLSTNQPPASTLMDNNGGMNYSHTTRSSISTLPGTETQIPNVETAWSFSHPNKNIPEQSVSSSVISNTHNVRRTRLTFPIQNRGVCHGLAGYFETVLYGDVELSTNPVTMESKSANMISWFPIYFPLKTPLNVPDNGEVVVTMYRQTDDRKVWYEWMVEVYSVERPSEPSAPEFIAPVMSGAISPDDDRGKTRDNGRQPKGANFGGLRRAASRNLREALSLAPENPTVKAAFLKIQQEDENGHHLLDLCRQYTSRKDESAGKAAALYLRTDGLKPPEEIALESVKLLLAQRPHALSSLQDDIISGLVRQNASVRQYFSGKLQVSVTTFFDEIYDRGDGAAVCLDTVVLDHSVWPSEEERLHCERELFQLFIAKLMESGHDLDGRSLKGIARLLAVDAAKLQDLVDDEGLEVILSSLDNRLPLDLRSQATLATVKYLESSGDIGEKRFSQLVTAKLSKARVEDLIVAFSATAAVFPVVPEIAGTLFLSGDFMAAVSSVATRDPKRRRAEVSVLELLNAACINKPCREAISKTFSDWLSHMLSNGTDHASELAAVVLAKVQASEQVESDTNSKAQAEETRVPELVDRFKGLMSKRKGENLPTVIEGLAYSSVKPAVKEQLAKDPSFLRDLIKVLQDNSTDSSVLYGGLMVFVNLTQFLPNLSEEQKKMSQLKSYAEASQNARAGPDPLESEQKVMARCNALVDAGVMPLLVECGKTHLPSIQGLISKIMLSLSRDRKARGILAQKGAVKLLLSIGTPRQGSSGSFSNEAVQNASHALARILISVNPSHVFPPSGFPPITSAIRPLTALLTTPEATNITAEQPRDLLPVFESLLALTNLASSPEETAADTIVRQAWSVLEELLLSNSPLIQRAACELVCNLMTCESGIVKYADGSKRAAQRLHVLLALTDSDDIATRRAAGGGLAMLTEFDAAIGAILERPRGVQLLLGLCQEDDEGLVHRGVACLRNMTCIASGDIGRRARDAIKDDGGVDILTGVLKQSKNTAVLQTGVEALKPLVQ